MFFRDFKIVPVFLKVEGIGKEVQRLKVKRHDRLDKQRQIKFGLTFDEFLHLLLRISLRSQKKFKMFYESSKNGKPMTWATETRRRKNLKKTKHKKTNPRNRRRRKS